MLSGLLDEHEIEAMVRRADLLLRRGRLPAAARPVAGHPLAAVLSRRRRPPRPADGVRAARPDRVGAMQAWSSPSVPTARRSPARRRGGPVRVVRHRRPVAVGRRAPSRAPRGCTSAASRPYDATHMGHANTYVAFDLLHRVWRDAGLDVHYVQNVTDVDDPLLERATATGVDWAELAEQQIQLFREDMAALNVLPAERLRRGGGDDPADRRS